RLAPLYAPDLRPVPFDRHGHARPPVVVGNCDRVLERALRAKRTALAGWRLHFALPGLFGKTWRPRGEWATPGVLFLLSPSHHPPRGRGDDPLGATVRARSV